MLKLLRFFFLFATLLLLCIDANSQEGIPLITNFSFGEESIDQETWAMTQDAQGQMMFANRRGIVMFDGMKWNTIATPSVPLSLFFDNESRQIFVGCKNNIGILKKRDNGIYQYASLVPDKRNVGDIEAIHELNNNIYFYSKDYITRVNAKTKELKQWPANAGEPYTGFFINKADVYVNVDKLGVHKLQKDFLIPIKEGEQFYDKKILFSFKYNKSQTLIGVNNDSLYLFSGTQFHPIEYEASKYVEQSVLTGGINIDQNSFVISTITGGSLVIDKNSKKTKYTLNYQTGIPDDEIYGLGVDRNKGLWLLHEYGMSRVDLQLPIRNLNHYPGLEGNLISMIELDSTLYVATSEGVYYLSEVKNYEEIEVLVKVNSTKKDKEDKGVYAEKNKYGPLTSSDDKTSDKKESIFSNIFGKDKSLTKEEKKAKRKEKRKKKKENKKKKKKEEETTQEKNIKEVEATVNKPPPPEVVEKQVIKKTYRKQIPIKESRKAYALQSITHKYNKIEGIDAKVRQLIEFNGGLLVAANTGFYEIKDKIVRQIIKDRYVNFITESKVNPNKFYIGTSDGLLVAYYFLGDWLIDDKLKDFKENVYSILQIDKNNLWVGCENVAYRILFDNSGYPVNIKPYSFKTDFTERILVRRIFNIPYFFLSTGLYSYNQEKDSIIYNTNTNKGFTGQSKYIFTQKGITWVFNEFKWISINELAQYSKLSEEFLELFDDISNIYVDRKSNIWVIDKNKSIYKIVYEIKNYKEIFDIYLNFIVGKDGDLLPLKNLKLSYKDNALKFHISAPYFVKSNAINFKYKIEGITNQWSEWSPSHYIDLPYLPNGDFVLQIKARNILGKETTVKQFHFSIEAPFYKKWWFYLLVAIAFGIIIFGVIRLREQQIKRQSKLLEEKIEIRTKQLVKEKQKTEDLLQNILPKETASELKKYGKAKARHYDFASVMFTDFKGFTYLAEKLTSADLVKEIDYCFSHFDDIIEKYHVEKIKTIGDAYMCACGLPVDNSDNPILISLAALEIVQFMNEHKKERKEQNLPYFELRVGIHTGALTSGVVGKKKFAYDIWGDTVNTAARLESSGEAGRINISKDTYQVIKDFFDCEYRGEIEAKNKGEISMYFIKRINKKYAEDQQGIIPNELFKKRLKLI